jgi:hypothetical protein
MKILREKLCAGEGCFQILLLLYPPVQLIVKDWFIHLHPVGLLLYARHYVGVACRGCRNVRSRVIVLFLVSEEAQTGKQTDRQADSVEWSVFWWIRGRCAQSNVEAGRLIQLRLRKPPEGRGFFCWIFIDEQNYSMDKGGEKGGKEI